MNEEGLNEKIKTEEVEKREAIYSASVIQIERDPNNFFTEKSKEFLEIVDIPEGAFSGLAVSIKDGKYERLSPKLDELMAKHFTNMRYIVYKLNGIGPISTKDPREKYEGEIDAVIEKTTQDLNDFKKEIVQESVDLEERRTSRDISEKGYEKAKHLLEDALKIYEILIGELKLKKRGFDLIGKKEIIGDDISFEDTIKTNRPLEIKYLPGGGFVILRGYAHNQEWQSNFGDNISQEIGLANIYKDVRYIAIEGSSLVPYGEKIKDHWEKHLIIKVGYDRLMKELVKNGFSGEFLELDSRFAGKKDEETFDEKELTFREAEILFTYLQKYNPQLAKDIVSIENYIDIFHNRQRVSLADIEIKKGLGQIKDGTYYHGSTSIKKNKEGRFLTSSTPAGFELGRIAFSDALSVIKTLLMNKKIQNGELERGIIVDFQGSFHLSYKSYFFDNPGYAIEVVLNNIHEILASHPDIENREDILDKMQNLDEKTWEWIFDFIGTIPFFKVAEATEAKNSVERGDRQRPMIKQKTCYAIRGLSEDNQNRLNRIIKELSKISKKNL